MKRERGTNVNHWCECTRKGAVIITVVRFTPRPSRRAARRAMPPPPGTSTKDENKHWNRTFCKKRPSTMTCRLAAVLWWLARVNIQPLIIHFPAKGPSRTFSRQVSTLTQIELPTTHTFMKSARLRECLCRPINVNARGHNWIADLFGLKTFCLPCRWSQIQKRGSLNKAKNSVLKNAVEIEFWLRWYSLTALCSVLTELKNSALFSRYRGLARTFETYCIPKIFRKYLCTTYF